MNYQISFRNLYFVPNPKQVLYIENEYDTQMNRIITENYRYLRDAFEEAGMIFVYMPMLLKGKDVERRIRYFAPYLNVLKGRLLDSASDALLDFMVSPTDRNQISPSFIYNARKDGNIVTFDATTISVEGYKERERVVRRIVASRAEETDIAYIKRSLHTTLAVEIAMSVQESREKRKETLLKDEESYQGMLNLSEEKLIDNANFGQEDISSANVTEDIIRGLMSSLLRTVYKLRVEGVKLSTIHELIDRHESLSRLVVTKDLRIILPDYNNLEIKMGALPKAIYLVFLKYPEGIMFKNMMEHKQELYDFYRILKPNTTEERMHSTLERIVNPLKNNLYENVSRIQLAFTTKFDEHLAKNYYLSGERSEVYKVGLDRSMIEWEK